VTSLLPWPDEVLAPRTWVGVRRLLARCLELHEVGALPATLMLLSRAGLGREAVAIELAAALVCPLAGKIGCECAACARVRRGMHPDVEIFAVESGSKEIKIKQVREEIVERLPQVPYEGRRRVIVLASAHTPPLNVHAASALLKSLEEPPSHATLLLLAANPARVLPTVVSRVVSLRVPPPTADELRSYVGALFGLAQDDAATLLAAMDEEPALLTHPAGRALPELVASLTDLLQAAIAGDGLALVRASGLLGRDDAGESVAIVALLRAAARLPSADAERALAAAAALLAAAHKAEVLHLDVESSIVAALAPLAARAASG